MNFQELVAKRRSHREYTDDELSAEEVQLILRAALMSPTSMNRKPLHYTVVDDRMTLRKLSDVKERGSGMLASAALCILVTADTKDSDCWIEDASMASISMQYQAEDLGIVSCYVQIRGRYLSDGTPSEQAVRGILDIPDEQSVLCAIAFGKPAHALPPHHDDDLLWERVHIGKW